MTLSIQTLKNYRFFSGLKDEDIQTFLNRISTHTVKSGTAIVKEGQDEDRLIFLLKGECSVSMVLTLQTNLLERDDRAKEVYLASAKDFPVFGEVYIGEEKHRTANIKTKTECFLGILEGKDFIDICETDSDLGYQVMKNVVDIMCDRFEDTSKTVLKLSTAISLLLDN